MLQKAFQRLRHETVATRNRETLVQWPAIARSSSDFIHVATELLKNSQTVEGAELACDCKARLVPSVERPYRCEEPFLAGQETRPQAATSTTIFPRAPLRSACLAIENHEASFCGRCQTLHVPIRHGMSLSARTTCFACKSSGREPLRELALMPGNTPSLVRPASVGPRCRCSLTRRPRRSQRGGSAVRWAHGLRSRRS